MNKGKFISFEGIEGVGKSSAISLIKKYLKENNVKVFCTREPGGTKYGEELRNILLNNKTNISPEAELLLIFSARKQHIEEIIKPKLNNGVWVICDRFIDSTLAYQGYGKKINIKKINLLIKNFTNNLTPDLTIFFDLSYELSKKRFPKNKVKDRFEVLKNNFFIDVYKGYLDIVNKNKSRVKIVDAQKSKKEVYNEIISIINNKLNKFF